MQCERELITTGKKAATLRYPFGILHCYIRHTDHTVPGLYNTYCVVIDDGNNNDTSIITPLL